MQALAIMSSLKRTRSHIFKIKDSINIFDLKKMTEEDVRKKLVKSEDVLTNMDSLNFEKEMLFRLKNGQRIRFEKEDKREIKIFCENNFVGIASIKNNVLKMDKVFL